MSADPPSEGAVFEVARKISSAKARDQYLAQVCGDDAARRDRILQLLENDKPDNFLESSAPAPAETIDKSEPIEREGQMIGPYKLLQQIGEGGFGVVYMAEQSRPVRRKVALKVIKPGMDTKEVIARFEAERQALAMMDHPNIAKVLDAGTTDSERPYFVMELVRGIPITDYCDRERLGTNERLELFVKACKAVQHAHQKGIIHRDIKPSNVLITEHDGSPVPKVIDFGVAKAMNQQLTERTIFTRFQQMVGTPMYMSPEQAELSGLDVDTRADIYSLGVLLYELLTGTTPFDKQRFSQAAFDEIRRMIRDEEPPKPSTRISTLGAAAGKICQHRKTDVKRLRQLMRGELDWVVMKALEKERTRRYETAQGFANDVERYLKNETVMACPPSMVYRMRKFVRRNAAAVSVALALLLVLFVGLLGTSIGLVRANREADRANDEADRANDLATQNATLAQQQGEARQLAERNSRQLARQLRRSTVMLMAAKSLAVKNARPVESVRLAIEAVESTRRHDHSVLPVAQETLLTTCANLGGWPLHGHEGRIIKAAITPDGRWLATAGHDGRVGLWDLHADDPAAAVEFLEGHRERIWSLAISADGQWLVTGGVDSRVCRWNLRSPNPATTLQQFEDGHLMGVRDLAVSADGRWLVTVDTGGVVRVWDLNEPDPLSSSLELVGHQLHVGVVAIAPDGSWAVTGSQDQTAIVWSLMGDKRGNALATLGHGDAVSSVAVHPNSGWLVTASDDGLGRLWSVTTGGEVDVELVREDLAANAGEVQAVAFSPNGRWLAIAADDNTSRLWNCTTIDAQMPSQVLRGHLGEIWEMAFSADSRWLATGDSKGVVGLWDLEGQVSESASFYLRGHDAVVDALTFSPTGKWLATGSWDHSARIWDLDAVGPDSSCVWRGHEGEVGPLATTADGRWLVSAGQDGTVRLWELAGAGLDPIRSSQILRRHTDQVSSLALTPDGRWLLSGSWDGTAILWDLSANDPAVSARVVARHEGKISAVALDRDAKWLATGDYGKTARLWDLRDPSQTLASPRRLAGYQAAVFSAPPISRLGMSPDGRWLVTPATAQPSPQDPRDTAQLWDLTRADPTVNPIVLPGDESGFSGLAVSPDSRWLITASWEPALRLWDLGSDDPPSSAIPLPRHRHNTTAVAFSSDGRLLVTTSFDSTARVWDLDALTTADPESSYFELAGHTGALGSVAISPNNRWVATGSEDDTACVWDLDAAEPGSSPLVLRGHQDDIVSIVFSRDSRWVFTSSTDGTVRAWDLDMDSLLARARRLVGRELTAEETRQYLVGAQ